MVTHILYAATRSQAEFSAADFILTVGFVWAEDEAATNLVGVTGVPFNLGAL
jgi:hypothetical protein